MDSVADKGHCVIGIAFFSHFFLLQVWSEEMELLAAKPVSKCKCRTDVQSILHLETCGVFVEIWIGFQGHGNENS